jgi:hypothetical protein
MGRRTNFLKRDKNGCKRQIRVKRKEMGMERLGRRRCGGGGVERGRKACRRRKAREEKTGLGLRRRKKDRYNEGGQR